MALEDGELVQRLQQCWIKHEALQGIRVGCCRETRRGLYNWARDIHLLRRLQGHRALLTCTDTGADTGAAAHASAMHR